MSQQLETGKHPYELHLRLEADRGSLFACPECGRACKAHDFAEFRWRHLNFFQHHCYITARVPRTDCPDHGVRRVLVPWARDGSGFTLLFEQVALMLAREMPVQAAARQMAITDHRLWRIIGHYVGTALDRLDLADVKAVAFDETASKRGRHAKEKVRALIWWLYADLKAYRATPSPRRKAELKARFDRIFKRSTGFATLDRLLARLHANRAELLRVLDRPEIPLHTNGSENDIRCQVIHRKISGTTRSDDGRDCRDAFLSLSKTCRKLGISFWDYLGARLGAVTDTLVPNLSDLVAARRTA